MICNDPRCKDKSPHDWRDDGCESPTYRCRLCGEYFDELKTVKTKENAPFNTAGVCPVDECGSEDYDTMHAGFELGDKVVILDNDLSVWFPGAVVGALNSNDGRHAINKKEGDFGWTYCHFSNVFSTTKSGWLKLTARLESQRAEINDSLDSADIEIKLIEEDEKRCQDQ